MKKVSYLFWALAEILLNVTCAVVAYYYCDIRWSIRYAGSSAPVDVAFVIGAPFLAGAILCAVVALILTRKSRKKPE